MDYEINEETMVIIPINAFSCKIIELTKEYNFDKPAFEILEENCEYYGSTYDGRIKAAKKILNFSYKIPILVEESERIIFFPTKASDNIDCCWVNHNLVKERYKKGKKTEVLFKNGQKIEFDMSKLSFENQLMRSGMLDSLLTKRIKQK